MRTFSVCLLLAASCLGQEFEVVSIKPNKSETNGSSSRTNQGRMTMSNVTLRSLIVRAYGVKDYQIECPDWVNSARFDISAKLPDDMPKEGEKFGPAFRAMLQKMLTDRFQVTTHREQKAMAVYGLVVSKNGIKLKEVPPGPSSSNSNNTHYVGTSISMDNLAANLSFNMDLPVIDMTGLKGAYDITLDWINERQNEAKNESGAQTGLLLRDAVQEQLGLELAHRKAPIDIVVVDHAEKTPTEN